MGSYTSQRFISFARSAVFPNHLWKLIWRIRLRKEKSCIILGGRFEEDAKVIARDGARMIQRRPYGRMLDGRDVNLYLIKNRNRVEIEITNYGGIVISLKVPDRQGETADVVLGYDDLASYEQDKWHFGAIIGRYANRIANGKFRLGGSEYTLARNNGPNHLHGGQSGFEKAVWRAQEGSGAQNDRLVLEYVSEDGEEGYPGRMEARVEYSLSDENEFAIHYRASADKDTVVNLTNHSYFNLRGAAEDNILLHQLQLNADQFTPVNENLIPTGELRRVNHTPFDFTQPRTIGSRIHQDDQQMKFGRGYDHNWVLNVNRALSHAATLYEPLSGRTMEIFTTEPGIQFYSGNFLDGSMRGKAGASYGLRGGLCLETQHFPDSPNHANFPSTVLRAGERYESTTVFKFSSR
jgi:aldose 1-epimerase